jgi:hypothetical protein
LFLGKNIPGFYCLDIISGNVEEVEEEEYENENEIENENENEIEDNDDNNGNKIINDDN